MKHYRRKVAFAIGILTFDVVAIGLLLGQPNTEQFWVALIFMIAFGIGFGIYLQQLGKQKRKFDEEKARRKMK